MSTFMIYDAIADEPVPLTQERLNQLIAAEQKYGRMIISIRESHEAFAKKLGFEPKPFREVD